MNERSLLLLGILMAQSAHGYQINDFIEKALIHITDMKKPTAYALLERMSRAGLVTVHSEQEGNRPPRKVYSITEQGRVEFLRLLRHNLTAIGSPVHKGDIALLFLDYLSPAEAADHLRVRLEHLRNQMDALQHASKHHHASGIVRSIDHQILHTQLEMDWLTRVMDQLRNAGPHAREADYPRLP